jgi:hypothetical protein
MCVCVPAAWPYLLLVLLFGAPAVVGLLEALVSAILFTVGGVAGIAVTASIIRWAVEEWLDRRSLRRHNEAMAEIYPHLRAQLPERRRRVTLSVVQPQALEPARPQLMPPSVRVYATPQKELHR